MVQRRNRKDSAIGMVKTLKSLREELPPAYPLSELGMSRFNEIIQSREASSWMKSHLLLATNLATLWEQWEKAKDEMETDTILKNNHGFPCMNPLLKIQKELMSQILAINKALGIDAKELGMTGDRQTKRNLADKQARNLIESLSEEDSLL